VFQDIMELPVQMVVLGTGDQKHEDFFRWAAEMYPGRVSVTLAYSEALSSAIYAGADLFLMPSKSEPCGLSQMIAMRYGTVPIVRETGGLKDTVHAYEDWRDSGNGFSFANYSADDMLYTIRLAVNLYHENRDAYVRLQKRAMEEDFSWNRSARQYLGIYENITGLRMEQPEEMAPAVEEAPVVEETAPVVEEAPVVEKKTRTRKTAAKKAEDGETAVKKTRKTAAKKAENGETAVKKTRKTAAKKTEDGESAEKTPRKRAAKKKVEENDA